MRKKVYGKYKTTIRHLPTFLILSRTELIKKKRELQLSILNDEETSELKTEIQIYETRLNNLS